MKILFKTKVKDAGKVIRTCSRKKATLWFEILGILLCFFQGNAAWAQLAMPYVSGNQLSTAVSGGCTIHLRGVDVDGLEFSPYGYGPGGNSANCGGFTGNSPNGCGGNTMAALQEAVTAFHASIVRIPLNEDFWFGCSNNPITQIAAAQYQAAVSTLVNYCDSRNVYVILDLHWSGTYGGTSSTNPCGTGWGTATGQQEMADANAVTFWQSVAGESWTKNNPAVFFDLYNEPNGISWSVWQNGGSTGGTPGWTPGMQGLLNAVRGTGANNVCLAGGLAWCSDLTKAASYPLTNVGNGIVYSAHLYGSNDGTAPVSWNNGVPSALLAASPVFVGEMGPSTSCNTDNATFDSNMIGTAGWAVTTSGIVGATAWSFTEDSCPNILSCPSTAAWSSSASWTTTTWGAAVSTWLATPIPTCAVPTPTTTVFATSTATQTITPNPCAFAYEAVNCAGPQTVIGGVTWAADQAYAANGFGYVTAGNTAVTNVAISGSGAQKVLYQSERYANPLEYKFTVPNGLYQVTLKNAETYWDNPGDRVFSVAINGVTVISNMDIFAQVGQNAADDHSFMVMVGGGLIDIMATATADNAEMRAIEIISEQPCSPTPTESDTPTPSVTLTATRTITVAPSSTWTSSPTPDFTNTPSVTFTPTPSMSPSITSTATFVPSPTATSTGTFTLTPTRTASSTATPQFSPTPTRSPTQTPTWTPTSTWTASATVTRTWTPTVTPTFSLTPTESETATRTSSVTATSTPTVTLTITITPSQTAVPSSTPSWTLTPTFIPSNTATFSPTPTVSPVNNPVLPIISVPYPNPSGGQPVTVNLNLAGPTEAKWEVFTTAFRKIASKTPQLYLPGDHLWWDLQDRNHQAVASGLYYWRIEVISSSQASVKILKVLVRR